MYTPVSDLIDQFFLRSLESETPKFPPFNVGKHRHNSNLFVLQLAVAGYYIEDIQVVLEKNILTVSASESGKTGNQHESYDDYEMSINGIARRKFMRRFALFSDGIARVNRAVLKNGILSIYIERVIPEEDLPKTIHIHCDTDNLAELVSSEQTEILESA